ncbi:hypothetical protein [Oceanimonas marisflavi]|uniref:hypothetical protein n=1 Tax=Oceanimonas marisflavi TaxID=2059724 RepID=UPI001300A52A|nr:hypothetical protein [Oceanimonas marisflavi]
MIKIFLLCSATTFISFLFVLLFPAVPVIENKIFLFLSNLAFLSVVFSFSVPSYFFMKCTARSKFSSVNCGSGVIAYPSVKAPIYLGWLSLIGLFFIAFDRVYLRGIDYTQELRAARYEWLDSVGGGGIGILGNLLIPLAYISVFYIVRNYEYIGNKATSFLILSSFFSILGHAFLNGGRSNILLLFLVVYISFVTKVNIFSRVSKKALLISSIISIISFYYVSEIVASSATIGDVNVQELLRLGVLEMYAVPNDYLFDAELPSYLSVFLYCVAYLFHGQWTAQVVYDLQVKEGFHSIVSTPTVLLDKLGLIDLGLTERAFSDTGVFVALPGSLYYDFGWFGFFLYSAVLGFIFGFSVYWVKSGCYLSWFKAVLIFLSFSIVILSPILPAYGFSYFSFIIFSFFLTFILNKLFMRRNIYF